jgi:hypothetical protein
VQVTRKQFLAGAGAGALAAAGIYELVDQLSGSPKRAARPAGPLPPEQHVLEGVRQVVDNKVVVLVPPLHHQLVTLELKTGQAKKDLLNAQAELEHALADLEAGYAATPAGLGITVGWGLPYFRHYVAGAAARYLPVDHRASQAKGRRISALLDAVRFPSDPPQTVLEQNDAVLLLRSDRLDHIADGAKGLVHDLDFWQPTSIRRGFAGGGFDGRTSLPKRMAVAAGVGGADLIPDHAELFLGFTSTQKAGLGPTQIANLETLGYSDGGPGGYFRHGAAMHVSHIFEDLEGWYINFTHEQRVSTAFRPTVSVPSGTMTVRQGPRDVATERQNRSDYVRYRAIGHSASIQTSSRLTEDVIGTDGTLYPKGTAIPHRADFNTLDNPFFWSAQPDVDQMSDQPAAGLHFVVFNPTSDDFHRNRLAMDGVLPDGTRLPFDPKDRGQGFNSVLTTTHRQNFLVPPRAHRSFPLAELLA